MELRPQLVPEPLWRLTARNLLRGRDWRQIRSECLAAADSRCAYCGESHPSMFCYEDWTYDDARGVATLTGFVCVCPACSNALHAGFAA